MLIAAAICPPAPLLLPGVEGRRRLGLEVSSAALASVQALVDSSVTTVVVLAEDEGPPPSPEQPLGTWRFGAPPAHAASGVALPLPFAVGMTLLTEAGFAGEVRLLPLSETTTSEQAAELGRSIVVEGEVGLLLMGNASACSTPRAPGAFREDAEEFNDAIVHAVRTLEPSSLTGLSAEAARDQLSDIRLPLEVLSGALEGARFASDIGYADAPGGVYYVCASISRVP